MRRGKQAPEATTSIMRRDSSGAVVVRGRAYTLGEISRGSGVSRPHITRIFNGKRGLSMASAQRISGFLGVPIEALLGVLTKQ